MTILFLHGWTSTPGGVKPTYLKDQGHTVINPKLPDDDMDKSVRIAQAEFDKHQPDVVVGSSRGGAVAMNINSGSAKLVLLCPAWKNWGTATKAKPGTVILHSRADDVIPFADSEELIRNSGLPSSALIEVGNDHRLADHESLERMLGECERTTVFGQPLTSSPHSDGANMPDSPHKYAAFVEESILDLLLQVARFPLSHFSEKSLQVRLSAKLLANRELATPVPTNVQHRYSRELELVCEEKGVAGRSLKPFLDNVYHVPPLQMEYGRGEQRRIDVAILAPEDIRGICDPIKFLVEDTAYITPIIGVEFGTEKTGWHKMPAHLSKDGDKLSDCKHGYSVSVMRNPNFGRKSLKGWGAKDETVAVFRTALQDHAKKHPQIKWIGVILHLAFGEADCFTQSGNWVRCDISTNLSSLNEALRTILTLAEDVPPQVT